jgi:anti-sigma factor RsiW
MAQTPVDLMCREVVEQVSDYLSHALSPEQRARFESHLTTCPPCTTYLEQMGSTLELAGELSRGTSPGDVEAELVKRFLHWHRDKG